MNDGWMAKGACIGHDPDMWFPPNGVTKGSLEAILICRECPVLQTCAEYAVTEQIDYGIWGGLAPTVRRPPGARPRSSANTGRSHRFGCGTHQAYRRHIRHGETACGPCTAAETLRTSLRDAARRARRDARKEDAA